MNAGNKKPIRRLKKEILQSIGDFSIKLESLLGKAIDDDIVEGGFWQSHLNKIREIQNGTGRYGFIKKTINRMRNVELEKLEKELKVTTNSVLATKEGQEEVTRKRHETFLKNHAKFGYTENDLVRFDEIVSSDEFEMISDKLDYITYSQALDFAQKEVSVKDIIDGYNEYEKRMSEGEYDDETEYQRSNALINLIMTSQANRLNGD